MNNKAKRSVHRPAILTAKTATVTSGTRILTPQEFMALLKRVEEQEKQKTVST